MRRLTLFAKGNLDLRDSLLVARSGDAILWNGINALLREASPDTRIRVQHETWTRSDALLRANGKVPGDLAGRGLPLKSHPLETQFSDRLFSVPADAYILSIQPDLNFGLVRHRQDGHLFHPFDYPAWSEDDRQWLRASYENCALLDATASMDNLEQIISRLRAISDAPILIYNVSAVVPGENIHCHVGMEDILSTRIRRFNLALISLSQRTGVAIIDVDRLVAQHGADRLKIDTTHFTALGCEVVAREVLRTLEDHGLLDKVF